MDQPTFPHEDVRADLHVQVLRTLRVDVQAAGVSILAIAAQFCSLREFL